MSIDEQSGEVNDDKDYDVNSGLEEYTKKDDEFTDISDIPAERVNREFRDVKKAWWDRSIHPANVFHKRSVRQHSRGWVGWGKIMELCQTAYEKGEEKKAFGKGWTPLHLGKRDAAIIATLFLGGFRRQELANRIYKYKDEKGEEHLYETGLRNNENSIMINYEKGYITITAIALKKHVYREDKDAELKINNAHRVFRSFRSEVYRYITFPISEPPVKYLLDYIKTVPKDAQLFPLSTSSIYKIVENVDSSIFPHWFRSQRAIQLAKEYNFREEEIRAFFLWTNQETITYYVNYAESDLLQKMLGKTYKY
jgi:hypothetical protein